MQARPPRVRGRPVQPRLRRRGQAQRRGRRGKLKCKHRARRVRSRRGARGRVGCSCALRSERGVRKGGRPAMHECGLPGRRARRCRAPAARRFQRAQAHGDSGPALPLLQTPSIITRQGAQWSGCSVRRSPPHDMRDICTCRRTTAEPPSSTAQAPVRPTRWLACCANCVHFRRACTCAEGGAAAGPASAGASAAPAPAPAQPDASAAASAASWRAAPGVTARRASLAVTSACATRLAGPRKALAACRGVQGYLLIRHAGAVGCKPQQIWQPCTTAARMPLLCRSGHALQQAICIGPLQPGLHAVRPRLLFNR